MFVHSVRILCELTLRIKIEKRNQQKTFNCDLTTRDIFGLGDVVVCHSDD